MSVVSNFAKAIPFLASLVSATAAGGGQAHPNVQPTLCVNYVVRLV